MDIQVAHVWEECLRPTVKVTFPIILTLRLLYNSFCKFMILSSYVQTPFLISPKGERIVLNKMYLRRLFYNFFCPELLQKSSFPRGGRLGRGSLVIKLEVLVNCAGGGLCEIKIYLLFLCYTFLQIIRHPGFKIPAVIGKYKVCAQTGM
jgi:hypothetical protein